MPTSNKNVKKKVVKKEVVKKEVVKKVSNKTKAKAVPATPVPTPVQETIKPVDIIEPADTISNYGEEFTHLLGQLRTLQTTLKELTIYTTKLEKRVAKDQKAVQKRVTGKRKRTGNGQPSGFSKPGPVSDELRAFLKLGKDELIARTQCTKRINAYCKEHGFQDEKDKRILKPDTKLSKLLRIKKGDELTFFNLQKYMKIHFPNKEGVYPTA